MVSFYEKIQLQIYFRFISSCTARLVAAAETQHSSLSAFAPFSDTLLFNGTARALLHRLPAEQGPLAERFPRPCSAACACHSKLAGIRFSSFYYYYYY